MLTKRFSLAAVVGLAGSVMWIGCSSDDSPATTTGDTDAGTQTGTDSGNTDTDSGNNQGDKDASNDKDAGFEGVDVTYGKCPEFTKCGGDVAGSWMVAGGCVSDDAFAAAKVKCPGLEESDVVIKANGTVVATATTIQRKTAVQVSAKIAVPKTCSPVPDCGLIATGLQSGAVPGAPKFEKAKCTDSGANCDCDVLGTVTEDTDDEYTTSGNVLTTKDPERTFEYCAKADTITYTETTPPAKDSFTLPFVVELKK